MKISFQKTFYAFGTVGAAVLFLYFGKSLLVSLSIAMLSSFILYPISKKMEHFGIGRILAVSISLLGVFGLMAGIIYLFSTQILQLLGELSEFEHKLTSIFTEAVNFLNQKVALIPEIKQGDLLSQGKQWVKKSGVDFMSSTVGNTAAFFSGTLMVVIYTFLLLLYRSGIRKVIIATVKDKSKSKISKMLAEIQNVGQNYLFGMSIMIVILGSANSLTLWLFGIDHPFLFGFLAALLAIIPYVGTTLGATIPVIFAFMTHESIWIPLGLALSFWCIQLIESNFLSPKIIGGNLNVNALAAIISLIVGGYLWGIAGMALFLPMTAIFKVFCSYYKQLKPLSMLMSDDLYKIEDKPNLLRKIQVHRSK